MTAATDDDRRATRDRVRDEHARVLAAGDKAGFEAVFGKL